MIEINWISFTIGFVVGSIVAFLIFGLVLWWGSKKGMLDMLVAQKEAKNVFKNLNNLKQEYGKNKGPTQP